MTNTYTITTDDAEYAIAVIRILECLRDGGEIDDLVLESLSFLINMCADQQDATSTDGQKRFVVYTQATIDKFRKS